MMSPFEVPILILSLLSAASEPASESNPTFTRAQRLNQILYPTSTDDLPPIYRCSTIKELEIAINQCTTRFDEHLEQMVDSVSTPTFENTILPLRAPLYEMNQLSLALEFYRRVFGWKLDHVHHSHPRSRPDLLELVEQVARNHQLDDKSRCLVNAILNLYRQNGSVLDSDDLRALNHVKHDIRRCKKMIRYLLQQGSKSTIPELVVNLMRLRRREAEYLSQSDDYKEISYRLKIIAPSFQRLNGIDASFGNETISHPMFDRDRVLRDGLFALASDLYGFRFQQRVYPDLAIERRGPDDLAFDVFDDNDERIGLLLFGRSTSDCLVLVDPCQDVSVDQCTILIMQDDRSLMSSLEVFDLFYNFGQALHHLFVRNQRLLAGINQIPLELTVVPAFLHQRLAMEPGLLSRINPDLSSAQLEQICSDADHWFRSIAAENLTIAKLAHDLMWAEDSCTTTSLIQSVFDSDSWVDTVEFLLDPRSSYHWANLVADDIARQILAWIQSSGGLSRSIGQSLMRSLFRQESLADLQLAMIRLKNPNNDRTDPVLVHSVSFDSSQSRVKNPSSNLSDPTRVDDAVLNDSSSSDGSVFDPVKMQARSISLPTCLSPASPSKINKKIMKRYKTWKGVVSIGWLQFQLRRSP